MRSLKAIAADMRTMGEMLLSGADELEKAANLDAGALGIIAQLFAQNGGGGPIEVARPLATEPRPQPPQPLPRKRRQHPPKAALTKQDRQDMRKMYANLVEQGATKEQATQRVSAAYPAVPMQQLKAVLFNTTRLATARSCIVRAGRKNG